MLDGKPPWCPLKDLNELIGGIMSIFGIPFKKELEDEMLELLKEILTDKNLTIKVGDEVIYHRGENNEENFNSSGYAE